jgi:hypothetical protein
MIGDKAVWLDIEQRWRPTGCQSACRQYADTLRQFEEF